MHLRWHASTHPRMHAQCVLACAVQLTTDDTWMAQVGTERALAGSLSGMMAWLTPGKASASAMDAAATAAGACRLLLLLLTSRPLLLLLLLLPSATSSGLPSPLQTLPGALPGVRLLLLAAELAAQRCWCRPTAGPAAQLRGGAWWGTAPDGPGRARTFIELRVNFSREHRIVRRGRMDGGESTPASSLQVLQHKWGVKLQVALDRSAPHVFYRWLALLALALVYCLRVFMLKVRVCVRACVCVCLCV